MIASNALSRYALMAVTAVLATMLLAVWVWERHRHFTAPPLSSVSTNLSRGWTPFGGAWRSNGPSIFGDSEDRGPKLMDGSLDWENYYVEADVRLLGSYGDAGLIIRSSGEEEGVDSYHGYFAGIRNMDNSYIFGRADFGWIQMVAQPMLPVVAGWYHIKLLAYGCSIATLVSNPSGLQARSYIADPRCLRRGRFGLKSYNASAEWRNLRIGPSSQAGLLELTQGLQPKVVNYGDDSLDSESTTLTLNQYMDPLRREAQRHKFNLEARPIGTLQLDPSENTQPAIVRGIVTLANPVLYLQDATGAVLVRSLAPNESVRVGDEVEAQGILSNADFAPVLSHTSLQILWPNSQVIPIVVTPFELASGRSRGRFVETEGVYLSQFLAPNHSLFLKLENDSQQFYAIISQDNVESLPKHFEPGSRLRLRGVASSDPAFTHNLVPFAILLPSVTGIQVVGLPPWWTPDHIAFAFVIFLLLAGVTHLILSYVQRWRHEAILRERERLALEIHDTLAQSFAGIAFQLQAVRADTPVGDPIRNQLDVALDMVRRSHSEAKRSITTIQTPSADGANIAESLRQFAERLCNGGSLKIQSSCQGQVHKIPEAVADAMFLVGQEAISNSVRHSDASQLDIVLIVQNDVAQLIVKDNGSGFVVDPDSYGFGLRGMARRTASVSAQLEISSEPATGTTVLVSRRISRLSTLSRRSWRWLKQLSLSKA